VPVYPVSVMESLLPIIRNATKDDIQAILDILNEQIVNSTSVYIEVPLELEDRMKWYLNRIEHNFPVIVVTIDNVVAGFGSYGEFRAGYKYTVEHSVYIHKEFRGKGLAKLVLDWLINSAKENDFHVMMAVIDSDNEASIALHQKYGFEEVGSMKELGYKFGRWMKAVKFLQLTFDTPKNPV
jgi:L-amino acid N-acyltransferase YncA